MDAAKTPAVTERVLSELDDIKARLAKIEACFLEEEGFDEDDRRAIAEGARDRREGKLVPLAEVVRRHPPAAGLRNPRA